MTEEMEGPAGQGGAQRADTNNSDPNSTISKPQEDKPGGGNSELATANERLSALVHSTSELVNRGL
jgi:hypothetical protein